jgi:hypothetical protein
MAQTICCNDIPSRGVLKRRLQGGVVAFIGYILSPLSWWNDLIVNIPLAYLMAWPFERIDPSLFLPAMVVGYWITNIVGLVMVHRGTEDLVRAKRTGRGWRRQTIQDLVLSLLYTIIIVALVETGVLALPSELLK